MTIHDISATIEKALAASGLNRGRPALLGALTQTIRDALAAAGLPQQPSAAFADSPAKRRFAVQRTKEGESDRPVRITVPDMTACVHSSGHAHRDYKLFVPSSYMGTAMPLVVMLHGCKQDPDDFARGTRMNELAEEHGFLVAYPAQQARANGSNCWNWFVPSEQVRGGEEPSLIAGIARQVGQSHAVDESRVFVAGLSAGAAMAVVLGAAYPEIFKAVGVHSGLPTGSAHDVPSAFAAMQGAATAGGHPTRDHERFADATSHGMRTIVFHGDADTTVNVSNGRQVLSDALRNFATEHGEKLTELVETTVQGGRTTTVSVHQNASGQTLVESWTVKGAGHAWSGGDPAGSYTDAKGPDASQEMVRFFLGA